MCPEERKAEERPGKMVRDLSSFPKKLLISEEDLLSLSGLGWLLTQVEMFARRRRSKEENGKDCTRSGMLVSFLG